MVRRTVMTLLAGGADRCVVVASADGQGPVGSVLFDLPVTLVVNPDPSRGMFSSIQIGVAEVDAAETCILLPADMPYVQAATVATLLAGAARTRLTIAAAHDGRRGHPIVLSAALRERILQANPDAILSELRSRDRFLIVDVPDRGVHRDVDRPEDLGL